MPNPHIKTELPGPKARAAAARLSGQLTPDAMALDAGRCDMTPLVNNASTTVWFHTLTCARHAIVPTTRPG